MAMNMAAYLQSKGWQSKKDEPAPMITTTQSTQRNTGYDEVLRGSPETNAALSALLAQLQGAGTEEQQRERAAREAEAQRTRDLQSQYTKEAAFADSQGAMEAQLREALQAMQATLTRASEGAGTSQSSMRALLAQQGAQQSADSAAKLGLDAAVSYGQLSSGLASILEAMTRPTNTQTNSLLQALQLGQNSTQRTNYNSTNTTTQTQQAPNLQGGKNVVAIPGVSKPWTPLVQDPQEQLTAVGNFSGGVNSAGIGNDAWSQLMQNYGSVGEASAALGGNGWGSYSF